MKRHNSTLHNSKLQNTKQKNSKTKMTIMKLHLSLWLFVIAELVFISTVKADICKSDNKTWVCSDAKTTKISPTTFGALGHEPLIDAQVNIIRDGVVIPLDNGLTVSGGLPLKQNDTLIITYGLKNGLTEIMTENGMVSLPAGKFDEDGDPIDAQAIYDSIRWYLFDPNQSLETAIPLDLTTEHDTLILDSDNCINDMAIGFSITPYTHTGVPNIGQKTYFSLMNEQGNAFILKSCPYKSDIGIAEDDVKVIIVNQRGEYLINQRDEGAVINQNIRPEDTLSASLWYFDEFGNWIDVTDLFIGSIVWGYQIKAGDKLFSENEINTTPEEIWMDGTQSTLTNVPIHMKDTTGQTTLKIQKNNVSANAMQAINQSEQSMRVIFKYATN